MAITKPETVFRMRKFILFLQVRRPESPVGSLKIPRWLKEGIRRQARTTIDHSRVAANNPGPAVSMSFSLGSRQTDRDRCENGVGFVIVRSAGGWLGVVEEAVLHRAGHVFQQPPRQAGRGAVLAIDNALRQARGIILLPVIRARKRIAGAQV